MTSESCLRDMRKPELQPLTGIRFYAALIVFISHVALLPGMDRLAAPYPIFDLGGLGVSVFFVLSGFILTYNYADRFQTGPRAGSWSGFLWDRLTKIYPVHFFTFLLALPIQIFSPNLPLDWRAVPCHLLLIQCFLPFAYPPLSQYLNVPSWSVSCEWFFYLLAPGVIFLVFRRGKGWVPVLVTTLCLLILGTWVSSQSPGTRFYFFHTFAPSRFPEFLTGIFLGRTFLRSPGKTPAWAPGLQCLGIGLLVLGGYLKPNSSWVFDGGLLYLPGAALLVSGLAKGSSLLATHLSHPVLIRLGQASFSFYMLQAPLIRASKAVWLRLGWEVQTWTMFWVSAVLMFVLLQVAALILFRFYEVPLQNHLRRWFRGHRTSSREPMLVGTTTPPPPTTPG